MDKTVAGKNEGFTLTDIKGPPENPDELVLKLADTGEAGDAVEKPAVPARGRLHRRHEI